MIGKAVVVEVIGAAVVGGKLVLVGGTGEADGEGVLVRVEAGLVEVEAARCVGATAVGVSFPCTWQPESQKMHNKKMEKAILVLLIVRN